MVENIRFNKIEKEFEELGNIQKEIKQMEEDRNEKVSLLWNKFLRIQKAQETYDKTIQDLSKKYDLPKRSYEKNLRIQLGWASNCIHLGGYDLMDGRMRKNHNNSSQLSLEEFEKGIEMFNDKFDEIIEELERKESEGISKYCSDLREFLNTKLSSMQKKNKR